MVSVLIQPLGYGGDSPRLWGRICTMSEPVSVRGKGLGTPFVSVRSDDPDSLPGTAYLCILPALQTYIVTSLESIFPCRPSSTGAGIQNLFASTK